MAELSAERKSRVAIGGIYVRAAGARLPLAGPLDNGACRTWQFCAHEEPDGTVTMRDTYWRGLERDGHDRAYALDDGSFDGLFPLFELAVERPGEWKRVGDEVARVYGDADLFRMRGGADGRTTWLLRPGAEPEPAYLVAEARMRLADTVGRSLIAAREAATALADLDQAIAMAEEAGADWDGSRGLALAAASCAGAPRASAASAGAAGSYGVYARGALALTAEVGGHVEVASVPCGAEGLSAFALMPGGPHGRLGYVLLADASGPVCAGALTPANLEAARESASASEAKEAFEGVDARVSGNAACAEAAARARELLSALGMEGGEARP